MKTDDELRIEAIEKRVLSSLKGGIASISEADFKAITASRLAWKYTAKCFAAADWMPIASRPKDDSQFLACTADGRVMIFNGQILDRILSTQNSTPGSLSFPATHWMPLPTPPKKEITTG